jgi:hypothetical protein
LRTGERSRAAAGLTLLFAAAAPLFKETGLLALPTLIGFEFARGPGRWSRLRERAPLLLAIGVATVLYLAIRSRVLTGAAAPPVDAAGLVTAVRTIFHAVPVYAANVFHPRGLTVFYPDPPAGRGLRPRSASSGASSTICP